LKNYPFAFIILVSWNCFVTSAIFQKIQKKLNTKIFYPLKNKSKRACSIFWHLHKFLWYLRNPEHILAFFRISVSLFEST
jgi:hypothetical protein